MGRLPLEFAERRIKFRIPYSMPGEVVVPANSQGTLFPDSTFLHNVDKPFEIHRVLIDIAPLDGAVPPAILSPPFFGAINDLQRLLRNYVRLRIQDTSKNEVITKAAQLVVDFTDDNTGVWEWEEPYTIVRSEGFTINVDSILPVAGFPITVGATTVTVANLRIALTFEGYLIVIAPPSETR